MYITYYKESKRVAYVGKKKPISYSDTLAIAEVDGEITRQRGCYLVYNEETNTVKEIAVSGVEKT